MSAAATAWAYLESFATGDPDLIAAHVAEDFDNEHTSALGSSSRGREEYRRRLPGFLEAFPDLSYGVEQVVEDGAAVAVAYRLTATSEGRPVTVRGVMIVEVADGLIRRRTDYWDSLGYLRQISPGSDVSI